MSPERKTKPARTASQSWACISLLRRPGEPFASSVNSALLPRQASCCNAFCVSMRQAGQLSDHQVHYIVRVTLSANAIQVPGPSPFDVIEREQALFNERMK